MKIKNIPKIESTRICYYLTENAWERGRVEKAQSFLNFSPWEVVKLLKEIGERENVYRKKK